MRLVVWTGPKERRKSAPFEELLSPKGCGPRKKTYEPPTAAAPPVVMTSPEKKKPKKASAAHPPQQHAEWLAHSQRKNDVILPVVQLCAAGCRQDCRSVPDDLRRSVHDAVVKVRASAAAFDSSIWIKSTV